MLYSVQFYSITCGVVNNFTQKKIYAGINMDKDGCFVNKYQR